MVSIRRSYGETNLVFFFATCVEQQPRHKNDNTRTHVERRGSVFFYGLRSGVLVFLSSIGFSPHSIHIYIYIYIYIYMCTFTCAEENRRLRLESLYDANLWCS